MKSAVFFEFFLAAAFALFLLFEHRWQLRKDRNADRDPEA